DRVRHLLHARVLRRDPLADRAPRSAAGAWPPAGRGDPRPGAPGRQRPPRQAGGCGVVTPRGVPRSLTESAMSNAVEEQAPPGPGWPARGRRVRGALVLVMGCLAV